MTDTNNSRKDIKTSLLKIRRKTMVFGNTIYQISNISQISVIDLSTTKSIPWYFWGFLVPILTMILIGFISSSIEIIIAGLFPLVIPGYILFSYIKNRYDEKYGLLITLNAGSMTALVSNDEEFIKKVAVIINDVINNEEERSITFNFDNRRVEGVSDSAVVLGDVSGDIVNKIS